jgi:hypothetical protein
MRRRVLPAADRRARDLALLRTLLDGVEPKLAAERHGVHRSDVNRALARNGWPARPRAAADRPQWVESCRKSIPELRP